MKQKKAYKYRFYPSDEQKRILTQTFGCCRYVYNWALRQRTDAYYQHGERLYYEGTAQRLVTLKKQEETLWLNEVSSVPLQQALRHLDKAFRNFFEGRSSGMGKLSRLPRWMPLLTSRGIVHCPMGVSQAVSPSPRMRLSATSSPSW
jgi:transposase